jgi:hypothetical protein
MALTRVKFNDNVTINGNVGVSTSSFNSKLEVKGPGANGTVRVIPASADAEASIGYYQDTAGSNMTSRWVAGVGGWAKTNQFVIGSGASPKLQIDTSGNVTTPNQPAFFASSTSADINISSTTATNFNVTRVNAGNHYSTSTKRFTAPVSGTYYFECVIQVHAVSTGGHIHALGVGLLKNGNSVKDQYHGNSGTTNYITVNCNAMIYLNQSDYVTSRIQPGTSIDVEYTGGTDRCHFSGYLIG